MGIFAIILGCRGSESVLDVAKPILNIFVDTNRLGIFPLQCLVANNVSVFKDAIIECIYTAIDTGENYWLDYLLTLLSLQYSFDMDTIRQMTALDENSQKVLDKILSQIKLQ